MDVGTAECDSAVWLPVGTYQVTEYITYSKKGAITVMNSRLQIINYLKELLFLINFLKQPNILKTI